MIVQKKKKRAFVLSLMLLLLLVLVACGGDGGDTAVSGTSEPAQEGTAEVIEEATEEVPEVAEVAEEVLEEIPTAVVEEAAEEVTEEPTAETEALDETPTIPRLGILRFRDSDTTPTGAFQLLLEDIAPPPADSHYELWLVDGSFNTRNLGQFEVADGNVQFTGETDQDLIGNYSGAFISIEPDGVDDGEIGPVAYNGLIPGGALVHIRHLLTAFPANPNSIAFIVGAQEQTLIAAEHMGFLLEEIAADDIREAQRHAEHVVNILDGEAGDTFGDLDGDSLAQNPGDGVGVRGYLLGTKEHTTLATDAEGATDEIRLHAEHVIISSDNTLERIDEAIAQALRIIASDSASEAQPAAEELAQLIDALTSGVDANDDGNVAPIPGEGGIIIAYIHAQNMGTFEFFAAGDTAVVVAPEGQAVTPEEPAPPEEEATAEAPAEPAPPAAGEVTIDMANFAFSPTDTTVSVGTTVTWVNQDSGPRHSATASDESFDTGLFDGGEQASFTFGEPGTFVYYCILHGSPDGSGMAATITVTE